MTLRDNLLKILADGEYHSGQALAVHFNMTRAGIWKIIKALQQANITIISHHRQGYKLAHPLELLDKNRILSALPADVVACVKQCDILQTIDSTNTYLMNQAHLPSLSLCLAEQQTAGRGRRGRVWVSPFASNIYLSLLYEFPGGPSTLAGLSVAIGVMVLNALKSQGINDLQLKWPNDILLKGRKVGGILIDMQGEAQGPCRVVIGVGINVAMSEEAANQIEQLWTNLESHYPLRLSRNQLCAAIITQLVRALPEFVDEGLAPFYDTWCEHDALHQRTITFTTPQGASTGTAIGLTLEGNLDVLTPQGRMTLHSGEVSVKLDSTISTVK
jgi:BirA family biotin operon repressor/biotin-[acetyl-CoA-carboxylase] ligase